jgi:hypothetical protein
MRGRIAWAEMPRQGVFTCARPVYICKFVSVSVPLQIKLGVLFIIVQLSSLIGYSGKFLLFLTTPGAFPYFLCS